MHWIERRLKCEQNMSGIWDRFCIELERSGRIFEKRRGGEKHLKVSTQRNEFCFNISLEPDDSQQPRRALEICLDRERCRVFARIGDKEAGSVSIGGDREGSLSFMDAHLTPVTEEIASQALLEPFLFPGTCGVPILAVAP